MAKTKQFDDAFDDEFVDEPTSEDLLETEVFVQGLDDPLVDEDEDEEESPVKTPDKVKPKAKEKTDKRKKDKGPSDDSIFMYLKEIGKISTLNAEQEILITREIKKGGFEGEKAKRQLYSSSGFISGR